MLTHAARAAAKQLNNFSHSVTAREGPWSGLVAVIPDPRAARSLRFSPSGRTVDGYHPSSQGKCACVIEPTQHPTMNKMLMAAGPRVRRALVKVPWLLVFCQASKTAFRSHCARPYSNQSPSRAPRAATRGGLFSCFAAARAASVSTWLGEIQINRSKFAIVYKVRRVTKTRNCLAS